MFHTFRGSPGSSRGTLLRVLLATGSSSSPPTAISSIYQKVSGDSYIYFYFAEPTLFSTLQTTTSSSYLSIPLTLFLPFSQLREQKSGRKIEVLTSRTTSQNLPYWATSTVSTLNKQGMMLKSSTHTTAQGNHQPAPQLHG